MKNIIQSVIDKEKECTVRLEKADKEAHASILAVNKKSKDLLDNARNDASRSFAEMLSTAEAQADKAQKEVLAKASTNYAPIDDEKQTTLAKKALMNLLGN